MEMSSKERMLAALNRQAPDRLPVTTHHLMQYFLDHYLGGMSKQACFDHFGLDAYYWLDVHRPDTERGEYYDPCQGEIGFLENRRIATDDWRIYGDEIPGREYRTIRYRIVTPKGTLTTTLQSNEYTTWVTERLIKDKKDIDLIGPYVTAPKCDVDALNRAAEEYGDRGLVRGIMCPFDLFGQGGCWQDAACLVGIEELILATFDDPAWVHELLAILFERKATYIQSTAGAHYDLIEHGGGDASSTVISPKLFDEFVAPYDARLIALAHEAGQRIVYHTCGGMMPILENVLAMQPDAMETFTPPDMGGDVDLAQAKARVGDQVCMIGGFDQFHYFVGCTEEETRAAVRRCFAEAGAGGGFILSPSDHFFDADPGLVMAFADEARRCTY